MEWKGKKAIVCTMHGKESVIQPALHSLELSWVSADLDTDKLGTFSGEVERLFSPLVTARMKCMLAFEHTDAVISIASEGSFGPHPSLPFLPVNEELLLFMDRENGIEVSVQSISVETNFSSITTSKWDEVESFLSRTGFPSHGIIFKADGMNILRKGILNKDELRLFFNEFTKMYGYATIETDMRAMNNPTRMQHIEQLAEKLNAKLHSSCPSCKIPGFGEERFESGLPCAQCGLPTNSIIYKAIKCKFCNHESIISYPTGKKVEDPQFCSYCNP